jgi:hypothetical protein
LGEVLSGPDGNPESQHFTDFGCPVLSGGNPFYSEMVFIEAHQIILDWMQQVAADENYHNPEVVVAAKETNGENSKDAEDSDKLWENLPDKQKPSMTFYGNDALLAEAKKLGKIEKLLATGMVEDDEQDENPDTA